MELIVDVLIEVGSIVLVGCICFTVYVYGKIFLIKIGLIDKEQDDESIKDGTDWKLIGKRLLNEETYINLGNNYYPYSMSGGIRDIYLFFVQPNILITSIWL